MSGSLTNSHVIRDVMWRSSEPTRPSFLSFLLLLRLLLCINSNLIYLTPLFVAMVMDWTLATAALSKRPNRQLNTQLNDTR